MRPIAYRGLYGLVRESPDVVIAEFRASHRLAPTVQEEIRISRSRKAMPIKSYTRLGGRFCDAPNVVIAEFRASHRLAPTVQEEIRISRSRKAMPVKSYTRLGGQFRDAPNAVIAEFRASHRLAPTRSPAIDEIQPEASPRMAQCSNREIADDTLCRPYGIRAG